MLGMRRKSLILLIASGLALIGFSAAPAIAQSGYPDRPVTLVVPYPAGGGSDNVARLVAAKLEQELGQPIVVQNRGGAGGNIGTRLVANAKPDGYTIGLATPGPVSVGKALYANLPYDPAIDLAPVILLNESPLVMAAHSKLPAELERVARYAGAEYCMTWLTVGPEADYCRFFKDECQRTPQQGDQVLLGIYLLLDGHWGHAIRSGTMGGATKNQDAVFSSAERMWTAMKAKLAPGADLALVHLAAEDIIKRDYPELDDQIFRFRHGHGLGHSYEDPIASLAFPQAYDGGAQAKSLAIQPGMLFELHPNLFVPRLGGAAIGDMVVTTQTGNRILTNYPRGHLNWLE